MIVSIRHKGLLRYYEKGDGSKLPGQYLRKINRIIDQLDSLTTEEDVKQIGQGIHKLTGNLSEFWSIKVTPNHRIIFRFADSEVSDVDFIDYH